MGITFYNHNTYQIKYDKIFAWPVPAAWSLEEAATVPLAYTMVTIISLANKTK